MIMMIIITPRTPIISTTELGEKISICPPFLLHFQDNIVLRGSQELNHKHSPKMVVKQDYHRLISIQHILDRQTGDTLAPPRLPAGPANGIRCLDTQDTTTIDNSVNDAIMNPSISAPLTSKRQSSYFQISQAPLDGDRRYHALAYLYVAVTLI